MEVELVAAMAQFGVAGLIGWMWLTERRSAATRERQLSEAHDRLLGERDRGETLLRTVTENTRAVASLEAAQRELARAVDRLATWLIGPGIGAAAGGAGGGAGGAGAGDGVPGRAAG